MQWSGVAACISCQVQTVSALKFQVFRTVSGIHHPKNTVCSDCPCEYSPQELRKTTCKDFSTYQEAKAWYDRYFPQFGDVAGLDGDKDGKPCEKLLKSKQLFSWKALPLNELRKECHDAGISHRSMGVSLSDEDKKGELVDRLILFRWAEHWGAQYPVNRFGTIRSANNFVETMQRLVGREVGLQAELATVSGLPQEAFGTMTRQELVENIKKVLLWKELPLDDLQEECLRLSLSWRVDQAGKLVILFALGSCCVWRNVFKRNVTRSLQDGLSSHQQQQELCERLVGPSVAAKLLDHFGLQCLKLLEGPITSVLAVAHVEVVAARARLYARTRF
ncbi:nucI [Symbiodinium pilosum]|uniref:NucI protein n=1 Tax=Symbiodinium pilosum TaxID=2952 RepID=A0A812K659_SYMPI|nr:nucI [Symbiodinium pilosum]